VTHDSNFNHTQGYIEAHHYITFCFLRAFLERSLISSKRVVVRYFSWLKREGCADLPDVVLHLIEAYAGDPVQTGTGKASATIDITGDY
jgi:hypothetical protein